MDQETIRAIQAADETFEHDEKGNAKFREFVIKMMRSKAPAPPPPMPDPYNILVRYGIPF